MRRARAAHRDALAESESEKEFLRDRRRGMAVVCGDARAAAGHDRHPRARRGGAPGLERARGTLRQSRRGGDRASRRARRRRRTLPEVERGPRLRCRATPRAERSRHPGVHRDRQPSLDSVVRHVRRDARRSLRRAGARGATGRAYRPRTHWSSRRSAVPERSGSRTQLGSLVPGKRADLTVLSLADTAFIPWEDPVSEHGSRRLASGRRRYSRVRRTAV